VFRLSHHRARGVADVRTETDFMAQHRPRRHRRESRRKDRCIC
jgi:hypothetical protein